MKKIYSLIMAFAIALTANSQLVINENFTGYTNPLNSQNGWVQNGTGETCFCTLGVSKDCGRCKRWGKCIDYFFYMQEGDSFIDINQICTRLRLIELLTAVMNLAN